MDISISSVVRLNTKELANTKNDISTIKNDISSLNSEKVGRNDLILSNQIANGAIDESKISDSLRQIIIGETDPTYVKIAEFIDNDKNLDIFKIFQKIEIKNIGGILV